MMPRTRTVLLTRYNHCEPVHEPGKETSYEKRSFEDETAEKIVSEVNLQLVLHGVRPGTHQAFHDFAPLSNQPN